MNEGILPWSEFERQMGKQSQRNPSYLIGRIEGLATTLTTSSDPHIVQTANAIVRDAETLDQELRKEAEWD